MHTNRIVLVLLHEKILYFCGDKRGTPMNFKVLNFTIFCISNVADYLKMNVRDTYHCMNNAGVISDYIVPCYDVLHSFSKEFIVDDIIDYMKKKGALPS